MASGDLQAFERLGVFYLGRPQDQASATASGPPFLYDSRDLLTHGLIVGMTGSGKTGLAAVLLEEAALDGIPAIVIDPKGDMANLALRFPELLPEDFAPWIDPAEAAAAGASPDELARRTAESWEQGIGRFGQTKDRIRALVAAADVSVYTPGSASVRPVALLRDFAAPAEAVLRDEDALRERVANEVSGLLCLLGVEADPVTSREHILLSNLLDRAWRDSSTVSLEGLVRAVQAPPFPKLGVLDLESFYPEKERFQLAAKLNSLLASSAFAAWTIGEPLDVQRLLHGRDGRPRVSVFSIAHLGDQARMFFVTLLLNEIVSWMRSQEGTGSLRALLYMDEIFGFFPPVKAPPSKAPMLTLLKQARAFGLGVLLATQNPVDLDYRGLSNIGTWFLGRLQTARDRDRLMEGLKSAAGGFSRTETEETLASLGKRCFFMRNVHEDGTVVFQTRWALSYLRGPLTLQQLKRLPQAPDEPPPRPTDEKPRLEPPSTPAEGTRPSVPRAIDECFLVEEGTSAGATYRPGIFAAAHVHFLSRKESVDSWEEVHWYAPLLAEAGEPEWEKGRELRDPRLAGEPDAGVGFIDLPRSAAEEKSYATWRKSLQSYFYRQRRLVLHKSVELRLTSRPFEDESEFRARLAHRQRERRDEELEKLRKKIAPELKRLQDAVGRAEERLARESSEYQTRRVETVVDFGMTLAGTLFGRKLGSVTNRRQASRTARSVSRASRERDDVTRAEEDLKRRKEELARLEEEVAAKTRGLAELPPVEELELETVSLAPRKSDIRFDRFALAWSRESEATSR